VEHLAALRSIPGLVTFRPADAVETAACWKATLRRKEGPTALALTRQGLPVLDRSGADPEGGPARGGYVIFGGLETPDIVLVATGSEVSLAVEAARTLAGDGVKARVVSMPSFELFAAEDPAYRDRVLPPDVTRRLGIEAGVRLGWDRFLGPGGDYLGMERFGASAPGKVVAEKMGFTAENVMARARALLV
jgi:transketolase